MAEKVEYQGKIAPELMGLPDDLFSDPSKYDGDIPLWARTIRFFKQLDRTRPQNRDVPFNELAASVVKDPKIVRDLLNNLSLVSQIRPDIDAQGVEQELIGRLESAVSRRSNLPNWTPDKIEELIRLGIDSSGKTKEVVERMKIALFNAPGNPEEAVDLFYSAAWAMVVTEESDIREEIFSTLCYEKNWLPDNSKSVLYFNIAGMLSDDLHIKKSAATRYVMQPVGVLLETVDTTLLLRSKRATLSELMAKNISSMSESLSPREQLAILDLVENRINSDPDRYRKLQEYAQSHPENQAGMFSFSMQRDLAAEAAERKEELLRRQNLNWPENLLKDPNEPLLALIRNSFGSRLYKKIWQEYLYIAPGEGYEKVTARPVQITEDLELDILAIGYESPEQKNNLVREVSQTLITGQQSQFGVVPDFRAEGAIDYVRNLSPLVMNYDQEQNIRFFLSQIISKDVIGKLSSIIEYYRPPISTENVRLIEEQTSLLKENLRFEFSRPIGRRGYELLVNDPALRALGYESITFRQSGADIKVSLEIDNQTFEFTLDSDYRIKLGDDVKRFLSPQDKAWLELLTLSHLKKLMCTGEDSLSDEMVGGEKQYKHYEREKIGRVEHLRRQTPGRNFTSDAYIKCLKSDLPIKQLDLINKMRAERGLGGTRETGIWTYISGVERDIDTGQAKPVKMAFATATDDLRKVIPLGLISPEEQARIEKEILAEFDA